MTKEIWGRGKGAVDKNKRISAIPRQSEVRQSHSGRISASVFPRGRGWKMGFVLDCGVASSKSVDRSKFASEPTIASERPEQLVVGGRGDAEPGPEILQLCCFEETANWVVLMHLLGFVHFEPFGIFGFLMHSSDEYVPARFSAKCCLRLVSCCVSEPTASIQPHTHTKRSFFARKPRIFRKRGKKSKSFRLRLFVFFLRLEILFFNPQYLWIFTENVWKFSTFRFFRF